MNQQQRDELLINMNNQIQKMNEDNKQRDKLLLAIKNDVEILKNDVEILKKDVEILKNDVEKLKERIQKIENRLKYIEEELQLQGNVLTRIETEYGERITTLFDAHDVNKETIRKHDKKIIELENKNDSQDVEIYKLQCEISS